MVSPDNQNAAPNPNRAKVSASEVKLRRILRDAPQDLWLETIRRTRSDAHNSLIYWMLSQPECDFAIAAHAFYRSNPAAQLDHPSVCARDAPLSSAKTWAILMVTRYLASWSLWPVLQHACILPRTRDAPLPHGNYTHAPPPAPAQPSSRTAALPGATYRSTRPCMHQLPSHQSTAMQTAKCWWYQCCPQKGQRLITCVTSCDSAS